MRKFIILSVICCIALCFTSCSDAIEIDDNAYVLAMGIDKGTGNSLRLTVELDSMNGAKGGGASSSSGNSGEYTTITMEAPSFYTAINMINSSLPRKLNFMQMKYIVFSEELAKTGVNPYITPLARDRQIRRHVHMIVSKEKASEFLKENQPVIGATLAKSMELMEKEPDNTGYFAHVTFNDFYDGIKSTYRQPVAILGAVNNLNHLKDKQTTADQNNQPEVQYMAGDLPREGGGKIELFGSAIFNGDKMVSELSGDETRLMMMISGDFKRAYYTIKDPIKTDFDVSIDVRSARKPDIKFEFRNNKPVVIITVKLEGDMLSIPSKINYESPESKPILEKAFEAKIKNDIDSLIKKCQSVNSDIFGFGEYASWNFMTIQDWNKFDWNKQFSKAEINTNVEFTIRRTGTIIKGSPIDSSGGEQK